MNAIPRLVPGYPLPAYSYVPGQFPHPHSDPRGHRFGAEVAPPSVPLEPGWADSLHYRLGIDLFHHGYYWEAHELWEALWHAAGRHGLEATFLKALIQLAVVGVKIREGRRDGAIAHARRAHELFEEVRADCGAERFAGLSLPNLIVQAKSLSTELPAMETAGEPVATVLTFQLM